MKLALKALPLTLCVLLAAPLAAQMPPGPPPGPGAPGGPQGGPGGPGAVPPDQVLKDALGLTAEQLTSLKSILDAHRTAADALGKQIGDAQKALGDALNAATPDATAVGTKLLAVRALEKQGAALRDQLKASITGILTADQKTKVDAILATETALRAAGALHAFGF